MLFSERPLAGMGAPPLPNPQPEARHFPQWSRTAILTLAALSEGDVVGEVKKSPPEPTSGGFIIGGDPAARVAHLEHSVRFLQEQHRLMLSGLHAEIEALRERNRDLQFQLIFNKESPPKANSPVEEPVESNETKLKREVTRLEREASVARGEAKSAEARAEQLQKLVDAQTEKLRALETRSPCGCGAAESRGELRARLGEAERLVRRLRADAERQRRELQCMKNSLHASLRASGLDAYGYQNNYHFPPVHTPDFWREPLREEFNMVGSRGRSSRRPLTLPELSGQQMHRSTVYANPYAIPDHTRPRANGHEKNKKGHATNGDANTNTKTPDEATEGRLRSIYTSDISKSDYSNTGSKATYPELKMVVTKLISNSQASPGESRGRARRTHTRKHADHT
ncbi:uncharacterized protein LOC113499028 isoform X2 [Trichoplusia ni]|uniref:Uncharacterized protein LOC113499028 isoform X2 n=1 Tax=Trichoplusia ni TaxID=7111 RepID=A0A7E5W4H9_TRINI|nr:uncharacterized protein LOC113499028 isoform X2 [Trichoplusia ni]